MLCDSASTSAVLATAARGLPRATTRPPTRRAARSRRAASDPAFRALIEDAEAGRQRALARSARPAGSGLIGS